MAHKNNQNDWWQEGLSLFFQLSGWLVVPIIIALFLGKWLDEKYQTAPWLFLSCTAVAFIITISGLIKESFKFIKQLDKESVREKSEKNHGPNNNGTKPE